MPFARLMYGEDKISRKELAIILQSPMFREFAATFPKDAQGTAQPRSQAPKKGTGRTPVS